MIIIEGIRRSGKTHTINTIKTNFIDKFFHKDKGVKYAMDKGIEIDDYVIGRDLTYAQLFSSIALKEFNEIIFDRQYLSSYVYGLYYRDKYDRSFWRDHIRKVEDIYKQAGILKDIKVLFIDLTNSELQRVASMSRAKDHLEDNNIDGYKKQFDLYMEALEITKTKIIKLRGFQEDSKIIEKFNKIIES